MLRLVTLVAGTEDQACTEKEALAAFLHDEQLTLYRKRRASRL